MRICPGMLTCCHVVHRDEDSPCCINLERAGWSSIQYGAVLCSFDMVSLYSVAPNNRFTLDKDVMTVTRSGVVPGVLHAVLCRGNTVVLMGCLSLHRWKTFGLQSAVTWTGLMLMVIYIMPGKLDCSRHDFRLLPFSKWDFARVGCYTA